MKRFIGLFAILAAVLLLASCAGTGRVVKEETEEKVATTEIIYGDDYCTYVVEGNKACIEISSNPTTGYQWFVTDVSSNLSLVENEYTAHETKKPIVGAGGFNTIVFKALAEGEGEATLVYKRNWEGGETGEIYSVSIQVSKGEFGKLVIDSIDLTLTEDLVVTV